MKRKDRVSQKNKKNMTKHKDKKNVKWNINYVF